MAKKEEKNTKSNDEEEKVVETDDVEEGNDEEDQDDEEESDEEMVEIEKDFSFSEGILATNKRVVPKKIRNLEEELKEEEDKVEKEEKEDDEDLGEDYRGKREKEDGEEDEEGKNLIYSNERNNSDLYEGGGSRDDLYSTGAQDTRVVGNVYSTGEVSSRTNNSNFMGNSYTPSKENKTSELDRVSLPKQSGLEEIGRKADKVKMSYGNRSKKDGISYN